MSGIEQFTLVDAANALQNGLSPVELCQGYLDRIEALDGKIGAFLRIDQERILSQAKAAENRRKNNQPLSPFDGIPIGIKDCIVSKGEIGSCASKLLGNVVSPYDATAVARLKQAGFIPAGRLNMDEFAMGSSCENSAYHPTSNPWDLSRVPGGSSGGSAAATAARLMPATLGSDTGGSIRQPAAFCGIVGLKPTYGRVSRYGLVAFASSLDQIGPMTNSVEDAGIILDTIAGKDPHDCTSLDLPACGFAEAARQGKDLKGLRIGLPSEYVEAEGLSDSVRKTVMDSVELARALGAEIVPVSLPHTRYAVAVYYIIATAEASANLARFEGVRYGARVDGNDMIDSYFKTRGAGFGPEVRRRILLGTYVLSSGYYDAYYLRAQKVRTLIRQDFKNAFNACDVLLTPVTPATAFKFGEKSDPLQMYLSDIFTIALNLAGNCGISIPMGLEESTSLPIGIQLIAPDLAEKSLLKTAAALEANRAQSKFFPPGL